MRKENESETRQITKEELIEVRKDEMQGMLPNLITYVGETVVRSKEIKIGVRKR